MAIETRNQELRFRLGKVSLSLLATHKARSHIEIPCTLCLIEQGDVLDRWATQIDEAVVAKVMDVLNEHLHFAHRFAFFLFLTEFVFSTDSIAGQSFAQDGDERSITR